METAIVTSRLVEARERIGLNRKEFAEDLGIPYRTITNYEMGEREPGSAYLVKVASKCGCTIDWLLGISESPQSVSESDPMLNTLCRNYADLNREGREKLLDLSDDLIRSGKYKKHNSDELLHQA